MLLALKIIGIGILALVGIRIFCNPAVWIVAFVGGLLYSIFSVVM